MRTDILTEEELSKNARINIKPGSYITFTVNETPLDRTFKQEIKIDDKKFNCIAHYIQYKKCQTWGLKQDTCDYILYKYAADYPTKTNKSSIVFEDHFYDQYIAEIASVPNQYKTKWREECPLVTAEAILSAYEQSEKFKKTLCDTKNSLIIELSSSILWGIDTKDFTTDTISNPINWEGENLYGQILMAIRDKYNLSIFARFKSIMSIKL